MAPKPTTGRFTTRKALESFVMKKATLKKPWSKKAIAEDAHVSVPVVTRILAPQHGAQLI